MTSRVVVTGQTGARPDAWHRFTRRLDSWWLRQEARLDDSHVDRLVPWALTGGLFVVLAALALARARSLDGAIDLSTYEQAAWLLRAGRSPMVTVTMDANVYAQQAAFIFAPLALLSRIFPTEPLLLTTQSFALAVGLVPLWRLARDEAALRAGPALALCWAYALYPSLHNLNLDGFHPETFALPLLLVAIRATRREEWTTLWVCAGLIVLCRADLGLAVAGLGGLAWASGNRREGRAVVLAGVGYTALMGLVVQPLLGDGGAAHLSAFASYGSSPWSVFGGMITHPAQVVGDLTRESGLELTVTLLAPVLFLPLLAPRYLLPVAPLQALYFIGDVPRDAAFGQQTVAATAFVFAATAFALARLGRPGVERVRVDRRIVVALMLASSLLFVRDAGSSPYRQPWGWGGRDAADQARLAAAELLGPERSVRASPSTLQPLTNRPQLYVLQLGDVPDPTVAVDGVDAVVLDQADTTWTPAQAKVFAESLETLGFDLISDRDGIQVFLRRPV
jgi:uncharacterized membrane protein